MYLRLPARHPPPLHSAAFVVFSCPHGVFRGSETCVSIFMLTFASTSYADRYVPVYPPTLPCSEQRGSRPPNATVGHDRRHGRPLPQKNFHKSPQKSNEEKLLYAQNI